MCLNFCAHNAMWFDIYPQVYNEFIRSKWDTVESQEEKMGECLPLRFWRVVVLGKKKKRKKENVQWRDSVVIFLFNSVQNILFSLRSLLNYWFMSDIFFLSLLLLCMLRYWKITRLMLRFKVWLFLCVVCMCNFFFLFAWIVRLLMTCSCQYSGIWVYTQMS